VAESLSSREKILDVAEALFSRRGYAGVGLREVAGEAGLGKSSLFHHFRSKAELHLAVLRRVFERIDQRLAPGFTGAGGPLERLDATLDAFIDALAEHPTTARLLLRGLFEDEDYPSEAMPALADAERALDSVLQRFQRLLREGAESGAFRSADTGQVLQTLIGATVYHFASGEFGETLTGGPLFSAESVRLRKREVKQMIHHGLATAGPRPEGDPK
jgi:TetR/AcrR family transcriptional regulator